MQEKIFIHPEKRRDELFLSNCTHAQFNNLALHSKRLGNVAYDGNGTRTVPTLQDWRPVFVQESEIVEKSLFLSELRASIRIN